MPKKVYSYVLPLWECGLPGVERLVRDPVWLRPSIPRPPVNFLVLWWLYLRVYKISLVSITIHKCNFICNVTLISMFLVYLSEDDPLVSLLWSGVRLVLECAEFGVGGPPYLLELPTGVERPPYTPLFRATWSPFPLRVGASAAYGSPLKYIYLYMYSIST